MFGATKAGNPGAERCYGKSIMDVDHFQTGQENHGFQQFFDV
jgi:hypothetical protein